MFVERICLNMVVMCIIKCSYCMAATLARSLVKEMLNLNETSWLNKGKTKNIYIFFLP